MPDEISEKLGQFFDYIWGREHEGKVYVPVIEKGKRLRKFMLNWPQERAAVVRHVLHHNALGNDVYYAPSLFKKEEPGEQPSPEKEHFLGTSVVWADFDGNAPDDWADKCQEIGIPEPTLVIKSSVEGHEHVYWKLDDFHTNLEAIEDINRAVAYRLGGDTSGWDINQLLRPPYTSNFGYKFSAHEEVRKPWYQGEPAPVEITKARAEAINLDSVALLGSPEKAALHQITLGEIPPMEDVLALGKWSAEFLKVFKYDKQQAAEASPDKRSGTLMRLAYLAAEHGMSDEQMYAILDNADRRWEKYIQRSKAGRHKIFLDTIARARAKVGYLSDEDMTLDGLLNSAPLDDPLAVYDFQTFVNLDIKVDWYFDGLIAREGMGLITGQSGVGKSQLAFQFGISAASGLDVLGWKNVAGETKVMIFSLEMAKPSLHLFLKTMAGQYADYMPQLSRNLTVVPLGVSMHVDKPMAQQYMDNLMTQYKPDLVIIDSLQRTASKELTDELVAKAMMEFYIGFKARHKVSLLSVTHDRKKSNDSSPMSDDIGDTYGSQFIIAEQDMILRVRGTGSDIVNISHPKSRLAATRPPFAAKRNEFLQYDIYSGDVSYGESIRIEPNDGLRGTTAESILPPFGL